MIKKYLSGIKLLLIGICFSASSCEPIYIPDPIDPRLPKYTEDGNNVAGAFINDELWKSEYFPGWFSTSGEPMIQYFSSRDSLSITFFGAIDEPYYYEDISFGFRGLGVTSLAELVKLNETKIELDGINSTANAYRSSDCVAPGSGQLYFRSMTFNTETGHLTLSGTFGFNQDDPACGKISVTYGRFDFTVSDFIPM
ncbi:MAG: hypothetical protein ABI663_00235 [Chryseolinea sp.]